MSYLFCQFLAQYFNQDNMFKFLKNSFILFSIVFFVIFAFPQKIFAIGGVGDAVIVTADTSPTGINNYINHTMTHLKDFVLDKAATLIAKQILHQLTVSVINWINTGFEGSPSFLTNPGAFFLDAADQVTGAFLATNGPLSALCSPFAIDIRLSLALSQTSLATQRYTCTVGKIIEAQRNGPDIIINGKVVRSSKGSMDGFLGGDFGQGGWPAFIALTTEPQNNPYGAFLSAQSDLYARIGAQQNVIHADLQLGQGFMSWSDCKDIPGGTVDPNNADQVREADAITGYGSNPSIKTKNNKDGTMTYRECTTQTPGSVISNTLEKNLNVPVTELELANNINAIINALMTKMVSTMLTKGLGSLSSGSSGNPAYTQEVITEINSSQAMESSASELRSTISTARDQVAKYIDPYKQSIDLLNDSKSRLMSARQCLTAKYPSDYTRSKTASIDSSVAEIDSLLGKLQEKYELGLADKKKLDDMYKALNEKYTPEMIQIQADKYTEFLRGKGGFAPTKIDEADRALEDTRSKASEFNAEAYRLLMECSLIY